MSDAANRSAPPPNEDQHQAAEPFVEAETASPTAQLEKERDEAREQSLRTRAEFINFQKRSKQQAEADRLYAVGNLSQDLLEVLDNLERAADAIRGSQAEGVASGLDIVHKQFLATLAKYGVEPIEALGRPFDPNFHDALMQQPDADAPAGTVVAELSKGYTIHDRVLRPSKVAVSVKP
ncbi:nucleotide exchange factor GrpE [Planctomyces sp. SH-PL62]|uniref:nucleotide exchange factor GrpE n=1 Tax=Planctomyces sp. SH-PL62 TaxID=1636152 RepID=UPI00078BC1AD|nr:nucleotide exchange factor GrpE [Planctomyces sp. SH-PL62]AMV39914.1 heat shock protein GrpE [Planctomyces sp. SH-PL62]